MYTYTPSKEAPNFIRHKHINSRLDMTVKDFDAWRDSLPDSPVDFAVRMITRGAYRIMDHRIALGNQLFAQYRIKLGLKPSDKETAEKEAKEVLDKLREDYKRITEGCARELPSKRHFKPHGVIDTYAELVLTHAFVTSYETEKAQFARLKYVLEDIPIYKTFLSNVMGIGERAAGVMLAELNPYRAPHASSFIQYLGLGVDDTGRGIGLRMDQHKEKWMKVRDGTTEEGYAMSRVSSRIYSAVRKSRILYVGGNGIIRQNSRWRDVSCDVYNNTAPHLRRRGRVAEEVLDASGKKQVRNKKDERYQINTTDDWYCLTYLGYKHRLSESEKPLAYDPTRRWCDESEKHRDTAARRYMIKHLVIDFWVLWRMMEGLPVSLPYEVEFLGKEPHHEINPYYWPTLKHLEKTGSVVFHQRNHETPSGLYTGELDIDAEGFNQDSSGGYSGPLDLDDLDEEPYNE